MKRSSTMSLLGLYNWDNTLFADMQLPTGMDKDVFVDNLLMEVAELEAIYPSAPFMKIAIKQWSTKMLPNWTKEYNALTQEYETLNNYDRTETVSETVEGTSSSNGSASGTTSGTSNTTSKVAGYNSTTLQNATGSDVTDGTNNSNTSQTSGTSSNTRSSSIRAYGNIGVTTSQQLLESEIDLRVKYNITDIIINDFKNRFCLLVY